MVHRTVIRCLIEGMIEIYNWPRRSPDAEPEVMRHHTEGPLLVTFNGDCQWLTYWQRIQLYFGWIDADDLQNDYYAVDAKFTARVVMQEPIGHISQETIRLSVDNKWKEKKGQHAFLWMSNTPPERAIVPVYAGEVKGVGAVELTRWDHLFIAFGLRTPTHCVLKALRKDKKG